MQRSQMRLSRELEMCSQSPSPGISLFSVSDCNWTNLHAHVIGPENSPYEGGVFKLSITVSNRYPFEPPNIRFLTPIYHPNIDSTGLICLDVLKLPPKGAWKPNLSLSSVLTSIRVLMSYPNPDDPLMPEIASEYTQAPALFSTKARRATEQHACGGPKDSSAAAARNPLASLDSN